MTNAIMSEEGLDCLTIRIRVPPELGSCPMNLLIDVERPHVSKFQRSIDEYLVAEKDRRGI